MMNDQQRYYKAYQQGIVDVESGIGHRLEVCQDTREYDFYIQGRKAGKCPPQKPAPQPKLPDPIEPIILNIE